ncbi:MAG: zinc ribbon domain-containing protein [Deltaproteobacteria bacterium]|jgi:putative FmdB family regulatory protein|nr:zinc ribbon domain-containing protein [Deltaproteobacteria bacterium]
MPIYEYECDSCGKITEATQSMDDPPLAECPECGGRLHKIMSLGSFQFKGSGYYSTDYKNNDGSHAASVPPVPDKKGGQPEQEKPKSYLDQTKDERKTTINNIVNKVANKM